MGRLPGSNMACPGQGLLLPNHLDARRRGGCAGLVKADGGAEPTCKIHFLSIRSLDKSMNLCVRKWTESVLKSQERKFKSPGSGGCAAFPLGPCSRGSALLSLRDVGPQHSGAGSSASPRVGAPSFSEHSISCLTSDRAP